MVTHIQSFPALQVLEREGPKGDLDDTILETLLFGYVGISAGN